MEGNEAPLQRGVLGATYAKTLLHTQRNTKPESWPS